MIDVQVEMDSSLFLSLSLSFTSFFLSLSFTIFSSLCFHRSLSICIPLVHTLSFTSLQCTREYHSNKKYLETRMSNVEMYILTNHGIFFSMKALPVVYYQVAGIFFFLFVFFYSCHFTQFYSCSVSTVHLSN